MSKCEALAGLFRYHLQLDLLTVVANDAHHISIVTYSHPPNSLLYFVCIPLKFNIDASAINTTLVFQVLVLLAFIECEKKMSDVIQRPCIQKPCYSS